MNACVLRGKTFRRFLGVTLAALAWAGGAAARADLLDERLNEEAPKIVEALRKQGYKSVGVLRFRVKQGHRMTETFSAGPINGNLATRLENALVIHLGSDERQALGVIHDASREAAAHKVGGWYTQEAHRRKLFEIASYPLAWGDLKVKADAFLTGLVRVSPDYKRASVTIEAFSVGDPGKLEKVAEFSFDCDVALLQDLGKSYSLARSRVGAKNGPTLRDMIIQEFERQEAANGGSEGDPKGNGPKKDQAVKIDTPKKASTGNGSTSTMVGDVEFKVLDRGKAQAIKDDTIEALEAASKVAFSITNKSSDRLGVDVRLNGLSVAGEQTSSAANCRVWVLKPGATYVLKGFYDLANRDAKVNVSPFRIAVGDEAKQGIDELGDTANTIQISVFTPTDHPSGEMIVSRNLRRLRASDTLSCRDLGTLQSHLMKQSALKRVTFTEKQEDRLVKRELIVKDEKEENRIRQGLKVEDFPRTSDPVATKTLKLQFKAAE
jgi:hypothetical protein